MFTRFNNFIASLQEADNTTKQRWVIGASSVSMVFVILLWLMYLSISLPAIEDTTVTAGVNGTSTVATTSQKLSVFNTFSRGISILTRQTEAKLASFFEGIAGQISVIKDSVTKTNVIKIKEPELPSSIAPPAKNEEASLDSKDSSPATSSITQENSDTFPTSSIIKTDSTDSPLTTSTTTQ